VKQAQYQTNLANLKKYSAQLNEMIETGDFYRLSFIERLRLVHRVKRYYNRLLGPLSPLKLRHILAAAAVVVIGTGCPTPSGSLLDTFRSGGSEGDQEGSGGSGQITIPGTSVTVSIGTGGYTEGAALNLIPQYGGDLSLTRAPSYFTESFTGYTAQGVGFVDLDSDGDLDAVFSSLYESAYYNFDFDTSSSSENSDHSFHLFYRENTGGDSGPSFGDLEPLPTNGGTFGSGQMTFADFDGDGDQDFWMASSEIGSNLLGYFIGFDGFVYYENVGTATNPVFDQQSATFNNVDRMRTISAGDIDNDGDFDLLVGGFGQITLFENTGSVNEQEFDFSEGVNNPFGLTLYGTYIEGPGSFEHQAQFLDLDKDGDLDILAVSSGAQDFSHYMEARVVSFIENTGDVYNPQFAEARKILDIGGYDTPEFGFIQFPDLDGDGDSDIVGHVNYYYDYAAVFYAENASIGE
jgi:hypothetical protein